MLERSSGLGRIDWSRASEVAFETVRSNSSPVLVALGAIYAVIAVFYAIGLPATALLAALTAGSALLFLALGVHTHRRDPSIATAHIIIGVVCVVVIGNTNAELAISREPMHATILLLTQLAAGALLPGLRWLLCFLVANFVAAFAVLDFADIDVFWRDAVLGFIAVTTMSLFILVVRLRSIAMMEALRQAALDGRDRDLREIIEKNPDAVVLIRDGVVVYANAALASYLGLEPAGELVGEPFESVVAAGSERLRELLEGPGSGSVLLELERRGGGRVVVDVAAPQRIEFESAPAIMLVARDVTESQEKLNARLLLADRMSVAGTLAAGVAHEINNPLTYVVLNLQALEAELEKLPPDVRESGLEIISEISGGIDRVTVIVRDLNALSRIGDVDERLTDPNAALLTAIKMAENQIRHRAELITNLGTSRAVMINDGKLVQVFLNILINAAHAIDDGGPENNRVEISSRSVGDDVIVEIRDTGCGVSDEVRARIFDPFFTTKPPGRGTGLGLFFCHSVLSEAGGRIELENRTGRGTCVRVTLPGTPSVDLRRFPKGSRPPALEPMSILVIDDEPRVGRAIARSLKGHRVSIATDGAEAITKYREIRPDLVLCDLMMPGLSGREVFAQLVTLDPRAAGRVVFMTGGAFTPRAKAFASSENIQVLSKPVPVATLLEVLANHAQKLEDDRDRSE